MRRQRNLSQMKEQDKATARDLSESKISNWPDPGFKATIIMLPGLEKSMNNIRETLTAEVRV